MVGLPKSIIAKYGVTKKAWQVFRGTKNSKKTKTRGNTMAKRKGRFRGKKGGSLSPMEMAIGSGIYGFGRPMVANMIPDVSSIPNSDNVILGVAGYLAASKGSGMIKKAGMVVLANEAFIAASRMSAGTTQNNNTEY